MGIITVLWEKWVEFKRDFVKITLAAAISPMMYLIVFGIGVKTTVNGEPYLRFLIPGFMAMSSMTGSFSAVAQNMSVQRIYEKALDQVMISPTPLWQFVAGQVIGGALRGLYAGLIIALITLAFAGGLIFNGWSILVMLMNGMVFSTIALTLSFLAKTYSDAPRYNSYIITPMSFLCNTFFSTDQLPHGIREILGLLPLSQASSMMRRIAHGEKAGGIGFALLFAYFCIFSLASIWFIYKKKNL